MCFVCFVCRTGSAATRHTRTQNKRPKLRNASESRDGSLLCVCVFGALCHREQMFSRYSLCAWLRGCGSGIGGDGSNGNDAISSSSFFPFSFRYDVHDGGPHTLHRFNGYDFFILMENYAIPFSPSLSLSLTSSFSFSSRMCPGHT